MCAKGRLNELFPATGDCFAAKTGRLATRTCGVGRCDSDGCFYGAQRGWRGMARNFE
jgi:hypothetical protein